MYKDKSTGNTYKSLITNNFQFIKQQSQVLTCYFLTSYSN